MIDKKLIAGQRKEKAALEKRWRAHEEAHPFGLMKHVPEGNDASDKLHEKWANIVNHVDPDMSVKAQQRLWEVVRICPGFQTRRKKKHLDQAQKSWAAYQGRMISLAQVAKYMHESGETTESIACEGMGIDRGQFGRMKKGQKPFWTALREDYQFCLDFLMCEIVTPDKP